MQTRADILKRQSDESEDPALEIARQFKMPCTGSG